jgi:hypothetical protein
MTGILRDAGRTLTDPEKCGKTRNRLFSKKNYLHDNKKQGEKTWI